MKIAVVMKWGDRILLGLTQNLYVIALELKNDPEAMVWLRRGITELCSGPATCRNKYQ